MLNGGGTPGRSDALHFIREGGNPLGCKGTPLARGSRGAKRPGRIHDGILSAAFWGCLTAVMDAKLWARGSELRSKRPPPKHGVF